MLLVLPRLRAGAVGVYVRYWGETDPDNWRSNLSARRRGVNPRQAMRRGCTVSLVEERALRQLPIAVATSSNFVDALVPTDVMAVRQTTTIKANITAYSTAVGPSSSFRNRTILSVKFFMILSLDECVVVLRDATHGRR